MKKEICILNYGSGNVQSVYNIIDYLGYKVKISNDIADINNCTHLILPGVGSFGASMKKIMSNIPMNEVKEQIFNKFKPILGICVGMQVMSDHSTEFGKFKGLGWVKGKTIKFEDINELSLPHIGWNNVNIMKNSILFKNFDQNKDFYFLHSYIFDVFDKKNVISETFYGKNFCSALQIENIFGVQFHPEKSQITGKLLLKNFINLT